MDYTAWPPNGRRPNADEGDLPFACPDCGTVTVFTRRRCHGTWPLRCRRCRHDFTAPYPLTEVAVDPRLAALARPQRRYLSDCYRRAGLFLLDAGGDLAAELDLHLAHGTYAPLAPYGRMHPIGHAWVRIGEAVTFDPNYQRFYDRADYEAHLWAIPLATYAPREACGLMNRTRSWGPWEVAAAA